LIEALQSAAPQGAAQVVKYVADEVRNFTGTDLKHDDITLIAISKK